ncbi:hypothetical protein CVT24_007339 [Panaeolus cyanescens]|uniref:DUF6534 domain-containing protein n=1 Tax=Panaeolus cyanescens TaxID=181874 RepID=A0A409W5F7_9AGAR|nr:hypothetical protein CVT24_007339 [Panaeolus cyanescens]
MSTDDHQDLTQIRIFGRLVGVALLVLAFRPQSRKSDTYTVGFPSDARYIKVLVYAIALLEIAQTVIVSKDVFSAFVFENACQAALDDVRLYWFSIPLTGGIVGGVGQLFFASRMWRMSKDGSKVAPVIVSILAIASIAASAAAAKSLADNKTFSQLFSLSGPLPAFLVWNGIGAICDVVISLTMPYYLMRHGTDYHSTHVVVVRLVLVIIETGIFTSIIVIAHLALFVAGSSAFVVPGVSMSKAYAITMLVILNRRTRVRDQFGRSRGNNNPWSPTSPHSLRRSSTGNGNIIIGTRTVRVRMDDFPRRPEPVHHSTGDGSDSPLMTPLGLQASSISSVDGKLTGRELC